MINNVILVGTIAQDPVLRKTNYDANVCNITLAINRPFKDIHSGEYNTDFINISLWNGISKIAAEYCSKGDVIGIKGRLISKIKDSELGKVSEICVIGEKIAFINLKKKDNFKDDGSKENEKRKKVQKNIDKQTNPDLDSDILDEYYNEVNDDIIDDDN